MTPTPYRCLYKNVPFTDEEWVRRNAHYAQIRLANTSAPQYYLDRWEMAQTRPVHPWRWGGVFSSEEGAIEHCEEVFIQLRAQQTEYFHCYDETILMAFTRYGWRNKYRTKRDSMKIDGKELTAYEYSLLQEYIKRNGPILVDECHRLKRRPRLAATEKPIEDTDQNHD